MHTSVLIVGAGLAGLSHAVFLGLHGVPALVVERHPSTSNHPKARGQMPHTMEALRLAGLEDAFVAATPKSTGFRIRIAESASGPMFHELVHDTLLSLDHLSPAGSADVSQANAERILAERARELGAELRFNTELGTLEQGEDGVTATLTDRTSDQCYTVEADYVVGADGHRSPVRELVGIGTHGHGTFGSSIHWLVRADLSGVVGDGQILYYLRNPRLSGGTGVVASTDHPDQFVVGVGYDPEHDDLADFDGPAGIEQIRLATGVPGLAVDVLESATTETGMWVADRFNAGRVLLIGDAAHTMPPQGGQGGNTAVMDGFYLAWKLAAVLHGQAGPALLDSHDAERRPVGELIAENQYRNALIRNPSGPPPDFPPPIDDPGLLFFGYRHTAAVLREADDACELLEEPTKPTGRPGSRAAHVRLGGPAGALSTIDLYGRGFVLLTESPSWVESARAVASELDITLATHLIGRDSHVEWTEAYGVTAEGAVLVRPDRFIAWRSRGAGTPGELATALRTVLRRQPEH